MGTSLSHPRSPSPDQDQEGTRDPDPHTWGIILPVPHPHGDSLDPPLTHTPRPVPRPCVPPYRGTLVPGPDTTGTIGFGSPHFLRTLAVPSGTGVPLRKGVPLPPSRAGMVLDRESISGPGVSLSRLSIPAGMVFALWCQGLSHPGTGLEPLCHTRRE